MRQTTTFWVVLWVLYSIRPRASHGVAASPAWGEAKKVILLDFSICVMRKIQSWTSVRVVCLVADGDAGAWVQEGNQSFQLIVFQGDAALRWPVIQVGGVNEDGAAPALSAGVRVMIKHDDEVIEMVVSPQMFGACRVWMGDRPVIVPVEDVIAPTVGIAYGAGGQI